MTAYTKEQILHDRSTRGEVLTSYEKTLLTAWYEAQDQEETEALHNSSLPPLDGLSQRQQILQVQLETALSQLKIEIQRMHSVTTENKALRDNIAQLQHLLRQTFPEIA